MNDPARRPRSAKDIFADAIEMPPIEREQFLHETCAGNTDLMREVRELLATHSRAGDFLDPAAIALMRPAIPVATPTEGPGSVIGRYKILETIGEGGFGTVFLAEQDVPVRRRVALKLIKLGMDTRRVVARFEQERQALAIMDHPNIAKVLDAGATETGRPYFVMELVKGDPITEYCDKNHLSITERLGLVTQVCQAVEHAHTKGVIHRDIKPSNVLVSTQDGRPQARIIDFGIAKATGRPLTEQTVFTEFRQFIGTPEYMSPEQADGSLDIDTRTDVYSLGVILYELLTGSTPFDPKRLRSAAYAELQRIIREDDPPKPSTRLGESAQTLSSVAASRRVEPGRLGSILRGELDWIVMKALEKDRARRYRSPSGLADDLQRYLAGDAVSAAPPGAAYRLRKFTRRNRAAVVAGGLIAAALVLGVIGTSTGMVRARHQRDRAIDAEKRAHEQLVLAEKARADAETARTEADRSAKIASAVTEFFTHDVLDLRPTPPGQPETTVREVLDRVPLKIQGFFKSEPAVEGAIRERVGQLYLNMGNPQKAAEYLEQGAILLEQGLGPGHRATMMAQQRVGELMIDLERFDKAEAVFDAVYQIRLKVLGPDHNFTVNSMLRRGAVRVMQGKAEEGFRDLDKGVADFTRIHGRASRQALIAHRELLDAQLAAGRFKEAEGLARAVLSEIRANPGTLGPAEPDFRIRLGSSLSHQGRFEEAFAELDPPFASALAELPPSSQTFLLLRTARAKTLIGMRRDPEAAAEIEAIYAIVEPLYGAATPRCRTLARLRAEIAARAGDEAAATLWRGRS